MEKLDIYYIDLNKLKKDKLISLIENDKKNEKYTNELKKYQHFAGIFLVNLIANKLGIKNPQIRYLDGKPYLKNELYKFSISHCDNYVVCIFSKKNIGIDIENNSKTRNYEKILSRFGANYIPSNKNTLREYFYDFWTKYEACFKLNNSNNNCFIKYNYQIPNYTLCVASEANIKLENLIEIIE